MFLLGNIFSFFLLNLFMVPALSCDDYVARRIGLESVAGDIERRCLTVASASELRRSGYLVERNLRMEPFSSSSSWGLSAIGSPKANQLADGSGEGVVVCLVDSGVDLKHPSLAKKVVEARNFTEEGDPGDVSDGFGHGTFMAGIVAGRDVGNFRGVAPEAEILVAKVFTRAGQGTFHSIAKGIQFCIGRADVINLSLGSSADSVVVRSVIEDAIKQGVTVVAAAGNTSPVAFPARVPGVIAVGASDHNNLVAPSSARGSELSLVAPGVNVFGPVPGGYGLLSGTSVAAAFTSGVEAIRRSRGRASIESRDLGFQDVEQGRGLVDAYSTAQ